MPALRRRRGHGIRRTRPCAKRLPRGQEPIRPGEIVQIDTLTVSLSADRRTLKQFTACDPVAKWTCAQAFRRATAHNAKSFLDKLQADMPFPVRAIRVDGGNLEDINRWIDAFADEFNTFRPHQALVGQTPAEYLAKIKASQTPTSHMS